ncbi:methyltransferase domain-containing protein [Fulvivirga sp. RKSG066]|uniref:methyltransferase n=1 Tax=Fulvivirga aurantia TaxID=2529383 RepID=UPI0012BBED82|nr:methyltransferase [Fulvivirga aurantia]MTI21736.1 methyltransferase domain-containing protein [Fulvivirga aurantia]
MIHDETYWTNRYETGQIQWDAGDITTPLKTYFDGLTDKSIKILIPGCGNAYEAIYLWRQGFKNVYLADVSKRPLDNFQQQVPDFPEDQLLQKNFFDLEDQYDLIVEQTFFCALHPKERQAYVQKVKELLKPNGHLMGVLFNEPLFDNHPPYGGNKEEYLPLFTPYLNVVKFETCYNSIKPRAGRELFILLQNS